MESPRPRPPGRDWKNYYLFGCTVRSNFPFQIELPPADGEPDLTLRIDPELPTGVAKQAAHLYSRARPSLRKVCPGPGSIAWRKGI